jgi:arylformamidase
VETLTTLRPVLTALLAALLAMAPQLEIVRDIPYGEDPDRQALDLYLQRAPEGTSRPVLVYLHGGGWTEGDKRSPRKGEFFARAGYVYAAVNYRLSPKVEHPVHVQDVARALGWLHQNVAAHGGDPERIFLLGHSAGAHLAALVTTDARHLQRVGLTPSLVRGVVLLDGSGYDIGLRMTSARGWSQRMFRTAFGDDPEVWADASPALHVRAGAHLPPFLLFHVQGRAPSTRQAQVLAQRLQQAGGRAEVVPVTGRNHVTINERLVTPGDRVGTRLLEALRTWTSGREEPAPSPSKPADDLP